MKSESFVKKVLTVIFLLPLFIFVEILKAGFEDNKPRKRQL